MERQYRRRTLLLILLAAAMVLVFMVALFRLQIVEGEQLAQEAATYTYSTTVPSSRGELLDRNGVVLVSNRVSYYVSLSSYVLLRTEGLNDELLKLSRACRDNGIEYTDTFPMSDAQPWTYQDCTDTQLFYFRSFLLYRDMDPDMRAENLMKHLRSDYGIPESWSDADARLVIGLRYELELRYAVNIDPYVLARDLSSDQLAILKELNVPGLDVETTTTRVYNTTYAAHVLGYTGPMTAQEYESLKDEGYAMNAVVGKEGAELAFESYLRGTDGTRVTTVSSDGRILDEYFSREPEAGGNVYLTLDIGLQQIAEETLEKTILEMRAQGEDGASAADAVGDGADAEGGAMVVMEVKTGQVLASASYPTYDVSTYNQNFNQLLAEDYAPLYNRVLQAPYPPGSTYKMVVGLAALNEGIITRYSQVDDVGKFTLYEDFQPTCLAYSRSGVGHGLIDLANAISVSCNYFFYDVGNRTGMGPIDQVARDLGLGEPTGVELPELIGTRANEQTKQELYGLSWYGADTLTASIGQSDNAFTPMQLACYVSALANQGTRYKATYLNKVASSSYDTILYQSAPEVASTCLASQESWAVIADGMELAVSEGTAKGLRDYHVKVAAKTGTASHGSAGSDNAAFVCYAPADDPEIAVVIYVEKGAAGSALAAVAEPVLEYYFSTSQVVEYVTQELDME